MELCEKDRLIYVYLLTINFPYSGSGTFANPGNDFYRILHPAVWRNLTGPPDLAYSEL